MNVHHSSKEKISLGVEKISNVMLWQKSRNSVIKKCICRVCSSEVFCAPPYYLMTSHKIWVRITKLCKIYSHEIHKFFKFLHLFKVFEDWIHQIFISIIYDKPDFKSWKIKNMLNCKNLCFYDFYFDFWKLTVFHDTIL